VSASVPELDDVFVNRAALAARVAELAQAIDTHLSGAQSSRLPLLVSPLTGGIVFAADVSRNLAHAHSIELVELVPYRRARRRGGARIAHAFRPALDVADRDIVLVDGIVDTGLTLGHLIGDLEKRGPSSVAAFALFDRPSTRVIDLPLIEVGFEAPSDLLVGYGLEHAGRHAQRADVHRLRAA
jgi:hypoxanthine phosphoribosyltransferase